MRLLVTVAMVPITWAALSIYAVEPLSELVCKYLPESVAAFLTKVRG